MLGAMGYPLEIASNYEHGEVLLPVSSPALLIANVNSPDGGDGHRLAEETARRRLPIVLIGGVPSRIMQQGSQQRHLVCLAKPSRLADLRRKWRSWLHPRFNRNGTPEG